MTRTLEILDKLISFDTVSDRSNLELIAYVEDFLKARACRTRPSRRPGYSPVSAPRARA